MNIRLTDISKTTPADVFVAAFFDEDGKPALRGGVLTPGERSRIAKALTARKYKGSKAEDALVAVPVKGASAVYCCGLGKASQWTHDGLRRAMARVVSRARSEKWDSAAVDVESFQAKERDAYAAQALAEGLLLSEYKFDRYKSEKKKDAPGLKTCAFAVKSASSRRDLAKAVSDAQAIAEGVLIARDLGNEPPNLLYPESYARRIREIAREAGVTCRIFDEKQLERMKMGGIVGVGQGSARKPRLVVLEYRPASPRNKKPVVLVGKGVTFDTGGISIKPSKDMEQMKFDMCGSAAVVAAVRTAAKLRLPVRVVGITPLAENMPGGGAQRPGDILRCYNGKTVDVLNTDAEGRLILADALSYAKEFDPVCVVDIATLTGLCAHFFDHLASGLMGNDADVQRRLKDAGERTGERLWELPMWDEYDDMIKGSYGDVQNVSRATAGTITAGMFLKHFGGHSPWAHLDVAGTAWGTSARGYNPVGATGIGVRLFIEFLKSYAG